jgi:SRSO17 transposase
VGVRENTTVWYGSAQPAPMPRQIPGHGRPRTRLVVNARRPPVSVWEVAKTLPARSFRALTWREGTNSPLRSRFCALRVRAANDMRAREEQWLLIEWPKTEPKPVHYRLCTLPAATPIKTLVSTVMGRWRIERDYQELKSELGLHHYEGRNWRGFHHHGSLCIAAYGFLMRERLRSKKNSARLKTPAIPRGFLPRGSRPDAATRLPLDRDDSLQSRSPHRKEATAMSVLRKERAQASTLLTQ